MEILNIIDDHSRLAISSTGRRTTLAPDVVTAVTKAFGHQGIPARVLTDNAAIFTGSSRGHRRVALELELRRHRVIFDHPRPYHPQTCGKAERFHQTQKKWLGAQPRAAHAPRATSPGERFNAYYNTVRPHRALNRQTPLQECVWQVQDSNVGMRRRSSRTSMPTR